MLVLEYISWQVVKCLSPFQWLLPSSIFTKRSELVPANWVSWDGNVNIFEQMWVNITLQKKKKSVPCISAQHPKIKAAKILYIYKNSLMKVKLKTIIQKIPKFKCNCWNHSSIGPADSEEGSRASNKDIKNTFFKTWIGSILINKLVFLERYHIFDTRTSVL